MKFLLLVATMVLSLNTFAASSGKAEGSTSGAGLGELRGTERLHSTGFGGGPGKNPPSGREGGSTSGAGPDELRGIERLRSLGFGSGTQGK